MLSGSAHWCPIRPDGVSDIDVRMTLRADDGELIHMRSSGLVHDPREIAGRVLSGEAGPDEYYFRDTSLFETASERYAWLNRVVVAGVGRYRAGRAGPG